MTTAVVGWENPKFLIAGWEGGAFGSSIPSIPSRWARSFRSSSGLQEAKIVLHLEDLLVLLHQEAQGRQQKLGG
jgi:hypothetical protein